MFYIRKPILKKDTLIRSATAYDLYNYKKNKGLFDYEDSNSNDNASNNNNNSCNHKFELKDFFANEYFFINCELSESDIEETN
jgi:hypothetical protein